MTPNKNEKASKQAEARVEMLEAISTAIVAKREEAINGRKNSGIETIWQQDEAHYEGWDEANRHEFQSASQSKPTEGGRDVTPVKRTGSTLFPNITAPYVDTAAAKISDMLMGAADWQNFEAKPTPIPDVLDEEEGFDEVQPEPQGPPPGMAPPTQPGMPSAQTLPQPPMPANPAQAIMADPGAAAGMPVDPLAAVVEKLKAIHAQAQESAKKTEEAIQDALLECQFQDEMRKVIHDAARIGTGVVKGPVNEKRKSRVRKLDQATGEVQLVEKQENVAVSKRVDARNCYPDYPACGEDIHSGNFFFEFAPCTEKQLRALKGGQGPTKYIDAQIDLCLTEGPSKSKVESNGLPVPDANYPRWYFYGVLSGKEIEAAGCECPEGKEEEQFPIIATLVNDRVIKIAVNPLEANEFPYDFLVWKARSGMPWGIGVTRQARVGQRQVTAATRNLMDNAGASAKPHKIILDNVEQDGDPWTWRVMSDTVTDARTAMQFFEQPSRQAELMNIIELGKRQVELETGLPMTVLGMQGQVEETATGRTVLNNNGSTVLRRIARNFDIATESHVRRYHRWLMLYSDDDLIKAGDLQIHARGSSSLVERDLQSQQLPMVLQMAADPSMLISKIKVRDEILKSIHFDPKNFEMDDKEKEAAANAKPPPPPQIAVAEINKAKELEKTQMVLADKDKERQHESQENEADRAIEKMVASIEAELGAAALSAEERTALNDAKVTLAGITMKLRTQRELSVNKGGQAMTPPTEPAGRAPDGQAFQA